MTFTNHTKHLLLAATAVAAAASAPAGAAVLADYDFEDLTTASIDEDINSSAGDVTIGSGLTAPIITGGGGSFIAAAANTTADTEGNSLSGDDYVSFIVTPSPGYELNLSSVSFAGSTSWGESTGAHWHIAVYTSVGGFDSVDDRIHVYEEINGSQNNAWVPQNVPLTGNEFQNLTSPFEVRFYIWDGASGSSSNVRIDDILLEGESVLVPEPSTAALLLGSAFAVIRRRRSGATGQ